MFNQRLYWHHSLCSTENWGVLVDTLDVKILFQLQVLPNSGFLGTSFCCTFVFKRPSDFQLVLSAYNRLNASTLRGKYFAKPYPDKKHSTSIHRSSLSFSPQAIWGRICRKFKKDKKLACQAPFWYTHRMACKYVFDLCRAQSFAWSFVHFFYALF